jgi:glycerol dehydrogenase-like iron-containing ADH family enzyme
MDEAVYEAAKFLYKRIKSILSKKWIKADELVKKEITDINIILSGLVSTLGRYSVTSSVAHAISYAMTAAPAAQQFLHGEHVAMGLIIQEALLKNRNNLEELESFFEIIDISKRFSSFGIKKTELRNIYEFYLKIKAKEKIHIPMKDDLMYNIFVKYM